MSMFLLLQVQYMLNIVGKHYYATVTSTIIVNCLCW